MRVIVKPAGYEIDGELYPRVTKILGHMPKPALVPWAAKAVAEFAVTHRENWQNLPPEAAIRMLKTEPIQQRDDAAAAGTAVHKAIEAHLGGMGPPQLGSERELALYSAALAWLHDHQPKIHASELTVFSDDPEKYAGTLDLWCEIAGEPYICDFKTSKGVYPEYALQLHLYRSADWMVTPADRQPFHADENTRLAIIHVEPTGYTMYDVTADPEQMAKVTGSLFHVDRWQSSNKGAIKARARKAAAAEAGWTLL